MAKKKGVRVNLVVEDEALERCCREVLYKFGFTCREIHLTPYPVGKGSAKDWVDRQYLAEVRILRSKSYQKNRGIVVGTDADELAVDRRAKRLAEVLREDDVESRKADERIVHWIPKWNVETWLLYFAGDFRDEDHNYKNDLKKPDYKATAIAFVNQFRKYRNGDEIATLPSLVSAYEETKRLNA